MKGISTQCHNPLHSQPGGPMALLCVMTERGSRWMYDEHDVISVCKKMRCGHYAENCRALMRRRAMECVLCHAVLTALKKPYRIKTRRRAEN